MDALEVVTRVAELRERVTAISNVVYRVEDYGFQDEISVLNGIKSEIQTELGVLEDKLRSVRI